MRHRDKPAADGRRVLRSNGNHNVNGGKSIPTIKAVGVPFPTKWMMNLELCDLQTI
jgi:hypothetical protein